MTHALDSSPDFGKVEAGGAVAGNGRPTLTMTPFEEAPMADRARSAGEVDESTRLSPNMGQFPDDFNDNWRPIGGLVADVVAQVMRRMAEREADE